jgi:hypothetical protein
MAKNITVLQVIVSSPSGLVDERDAVAEAIEELNSVWSKTETVQLKALRWESDTRPALGNPQDVVNEQLGDDYDIFLGLMGSRFGTPTGKADSGTEEEFNRAAKRFEKDPASVAVMFYFKESPPPSLSDIDPEQLKRVQDFRKRVEKMGLIKTFKTRDELSRLIRMHLTEEVQRWQEKTAPPPTVKGSVLSTSEAPWGELATAPEETVEEGYIDLLERGEDAFNSLTETMQRIAAASTESSERANKRSADMKEIASRGAPADLKAVKRVAEATADDFTDFAARIDAETPIYSETFKRGIDAFLKVMAMPDASASRDDLTKVQTAITSTITGLEALLESYRGLKDTINGLPRVTTAFNQGKRKVSLAVDRLIAEFEKSLRLSRELLEVVTKRIESQ